MTYITLDGQTFATDTATEIAEAKAAMAAHDVTEAKVYACSYDTIEAAEAAGFDGSYANGQILLVGDSPKVVTVTVDGAEYTATVEDGRVTIAKDGVWAGKGRWNGDQVEDCAADLGDDAYEAIDAAIRAAE